MGTHPTLQPMHPAVQRAYSQIHKWLKTIDRDEVYGNRTYKVREYKDFLYDDINEKFLSHLSFFSAAVQFDCYFHAHFFKVKYALEQNIGAENLVAWLTYNPYLAVVDVGSGAGAATVALLDKLLGLYETRAVAHPIKLLCLGVEPNQFAAALYTRFLRELEPVLSNAGIELSSSVMLEGIPNDTVKICTCLQEARKGWDVPSVSHAFVFNVNTVSPLSQDFESGQEKRALYEQYAGSHAEENSQFGIQEAITFKTILENTNIDHMHVITISTSHRMLPERAQELATAINAQFSESNHKVRSYSSEPVYITYWNPVDCRWNKTFEATQHTARDPFYIHVHSITSADYLRDSDWQEVISEEKMKLAWARVRRELTQEAYFDEIEIRLFEAELDENLLRLRNQLIAYAKPFLPIEAPTPYWTPKNDSVSRPRGLSRIEEEILSVAIIQRLGKKVTDLTEKSYAYWVSNNETSEYLYTWWLTNYTKFHQKASEAARRHPKGVVIRVDIRSYFTEILQAKLIELSESELQLDRRIKWLLELLLKKNVDPDQVGKGLVQGGIGSGFYANIYLRPIDKVFGNANEWDVEFFRYVDDMILVVPDPSDVRAVEDRLDKELRELGLEQNQGKRQIFDNVEEFLSSVAPDDIIETLSQTYNEITNPLWIMGSGYQRVFEEASDSKEIWWHKVELYRECLSALFIYVTPGELSRKLQKYLFNENAKERDWPQELELRFPTLPRSKSLEESVKWADSFRLANPEWYSKLQSVRHELVEIFRQSVKELREDPAPAISRVLQTRIRFALNRLVCLGFSGVDRELVELFRDQFWVVRDSMYVIESFARQGFASQIRDLLDFFKTREENNPGLDYMQAVCIRALRFLPENIMLKWDEIAEMAVKGSLVTKLMATETWLYREPASPPISVEHIASILETLKQGQLPPFRLVRNYVLLLEQYAPDSIATLDTSITENPQIATVLRLTKQGSLNLFDYEEPDILRKRYYTRRGSSREEEYQG